MKITVNLSENEVKGIKAYLKDFDGITPSKNDIVVYINGIVNATLQCQQESVSEYIQKFAI